MKNAILIFPNSLFEHGQIINEYGATSDIFMIEHPVYFTLYSYHKLKLILHRSSMKYYADYVLDVWKKRVKYINVDSYKSSIKSICKKYDQLIYYNPTEIIIEQEFEKYKNCQIIYDTPLFLLNLDDIETYAKIVNGKNYVHANFYKWMRTKFNILVTKSGKPIGGSWSYDTDNRKTWPSSNKLKDLYQFNYNTGPYVTDAIKYVNMNFGKNPGSTKFYLPIDFKSVKKYFKNFLTQRLRNFGPYEDAVNSKINVGYHSLISPLLNIGLLTPVYVIKSTLDFISKNKIPISSSEGFIRQIIGWREFVRLMYVVNHDVMTKLNYFKHNQKLDRNIWYKFPAKSTEFEFIDQMIYDVHETAYLHHIQRLMYIGNWFILNRVKPSECYDWFMTFFIDSYNWVMMANVYAMSQWSTGRLMMTRPYFSSSSYISKMSDYKKNTYDIVVDGKKYSWNDVWDALYWQFIADNRNTFKSNYSISSQVTFYNKKSFVDKKYIKQLANEYMANY